MSSVTGCVIDVAAMMRDFCALKARVAALENIVKNSNSAESKPVDGAQPFGEHNNAIAPFSDTGCSGCIHENVFGREWDEFCSVCSRYQVVIAPDNYSQKTAQ